MSVEAYATEEGVMSILSRASPSIVRGISFKSRDVSALDFFAVTEIEVTAKSKVGDCMKACELLMYISLSCEEAKCVPL